MEIPQASLERILQAGDLAKVKLFQSLVKKVSEGSEISASQLKAFNALSLELQAKSGNSEKPHLILGYLEAAEYCGFSKRTLSYHIKRGNITQKADGSFDREALDGFLALNGRKKRKKGRDLTGAAEISGLPIDEVERLDAEYKVRLAKLKFEEKAKQLVRKADVERAAFDCARQIRDEMLGIPDRIADILAVITDPEKIREELTKEIKHALRSLSDA